MKSLADNFVLDPESTGDRMKHDHERSLEIHFESQKREIVGIKVVREEVELNPLAELLKGVGV